MEDVIVTVTWTRNDIRSKLTEILGRGPTDEELEKAVARFDSAGYECDCIWRGWEFVERAARAVEMDRIKKEA